MRLHPLVPAARLRAGVQPAAGQSLLLHKGPSAFLSGSRVDPAGEFSSPSTSGELLSQHEAGLGVLQGFFLPCLRPHGSVSVF